MPTIFNTILIPVDFTINTTVALQKAIVMAEGGNINLHLLHVTKIKSPHLKRFYRSCPNQSFSPKDPISRQATEKMEQLKGYILDKNRNIQVLTSVCYGTSVEHAVRTKANEIGVDLIIICKNSSHSWLPFRNTLEPGRIARNTHRPVLTVKPGSIDQTIKTVVVPIGNQFPDNKVAMVDALNKKFRMHVRLVAFCTRGDLAPIPAALLNAYRVLKSKPLNNVSFDLLTGTNQPRSILKYCKAINADMVIVHPGSETRIGWFNKQISDLLPVKSKTQILAINQG